ncbi:hypothetical protein LPMP_311630 [Leishmania panamensis]|uniref:Uncharacterized protein n=1 Tax=Leishmania panamensis TaxID=5679 RepID=A0A088RX85_LEIPA|nr:hypothetical protein LPMP_311630 [Leishmania panamensis]AIO00753.1 hypothetical protein LPMP_311630 [Leishmania panamensis]
MQTESSSMTPASTSEKPHRRLVASTPVPPSNQLADSTMSIIDLSPEALRRSSIVAEAVTSRVETASAMSTSKPRSAYANGECVAPSSLGTPSRAMVASHVPALVVKHLNTSAPQRGTSKEFSPGTQSPLKNKAAAPTYKAASRTVAHVGASTVRRIPVTSNPIMPRGTYRSPCMLPSPDAAERGSRPQHNGTSPPLPSSVAVSVPCALYDLHHALQHRLVEDLGWSLYWYLDTETEIKQVELGQETKDPSFREKVKATTAAAERKTNEAVRDGGNPGSTVVTPHVSHKADRQRSFTSGDVLNNSTSSAVTACYSDPNTPQYHPRLDANGRELPFSVQESRFGVITNHLDCYICHDLSAAALSAASQLHHSKLNRSPFEYRLASLQRWLRKRGIESARDKLLTSCLSLETQRYLAYLGLADCWTSLFVTAGLPVVTSVAASSPMSPCTTSPCLPTTLSRAASRFDRIPLSFHVFPALCRWKCLAPLRRDRILRESVMHPFPLSEAFSQDYSCAPSAQLQSGVEASEVQAAAIEMSSSLPPLTFFTIQQRSLLPGRRRSSISCSQVASLGESCACDVYLVAATGMGTEDGAETVEAIASVWGYVKREDVDSRTPSLVSSPAAAAAAQQGGGGTKKKTTTTTSAKSPSGELFYIASSVENYLRLGLVFGWIYGWQMCFSSTGPPPNSVLWLRLVSSSAYEAARATSKGTSP